MSRSTLSVRLRRPSRGFRRHAVRRSTLATATCPNNCPYPPLIRRSILLRLRSWCLGSRRTACPLRVVDAYAQIFCLQTISHISGVGPWASERCSSQPHRPRAVDPDGAGARCINLEDLRTVLGQAIRPSESCTLTSPRHLQLIPRSLFQPANTPPDHSPIAPVAWCAIRDSAAPSARRERAESPPVQFRSGQSFWRSKRQPGANVIRETVGRSTAMMPVLQSSIPAASSKMSFPIAPRPSALVAEVQFTLMLRLPPVVM